MKNSLKTFDYSLKFGIYNSYGMLKDKLQDLLLYYSANEKKMITFAEYVENMKEDQKGTILPVVKLMKRLIIYQL